MICRNRCAFRQKKDDDSLMKQTKPSIFQPLLQLFVDFICSFVSHHHFSCCEQQIVSENVFVVPKWRALFDRLLFFPNRKEVTLRIWQLKCWSCNTIRFFPEHKTQNGEWRARKAEQLFVPVPLAIKEN